MTPTGTSSTSRRATVPGALFYAVATILLTATFFFTITTGIGAAERASEESFRSAVFGATFSVGLFAVFGVTAVFVAIGAITGRKNRGFFYAMGSLLIAILTCAGGVIYGAVTAFDGPPTSIAGAALGVAAGGLLGVLSSVVFGDLE